MRNSILNVSYGGGLSINEPQHFQQCGMCDQQKLRPACAYAQSDQNLCLSLEYYMTVKLLSEHYLEFLSLTGCTGSSESTPVKIPHCWKSHVADQMCQAKGTSWHVSLLKTHISLHIHIS